MKEDFVTDRQREINAYPPLVGTNVDDARVFPVSFEEAHREGIPHRAVHSEILWGENYLFCHRADGRWEIPGCGHVDWLETDNRPEENRAAAAREICEELALAKAWRMTLVQVQARIDPYISSLGKTVNRLKSSHGKNHENVEVFQLDWQNDWPDPTSQRTSDEGQYDFRWLSLDEICQVTSDNSQGANSALRLFLKRRAIHVGDD